MPFIDNTVFNIKIQVKLEGENNVKEIANLIAPIICIFVRFISDLAALFFKFVTTTTVAFANKSSDKLEERDADKKKNITLIRACFKVFQFEISNYMYYFQFVSVPSRTHKFQLNLILVKIHMFG